MADVASETRNGKTLYVMAATSAFGCGVDIQNVRAFIHRWVPHTIIGFLQESGRADRDRNEAVSIVPATDGKDMEMVGADDNVFGSYDSMESNLRKNVEEDIAERWTDLKWKNDDKGFGRIYEFMNQQQGFQRWALDKYNDDFSGQGKCFERGVPGCDK